MTAAAVRETREQIVERYNDRHALVLLGDRPVVLREGEGSDGREEIRLLSIDGFHQWMRTDFAWVRQDDSPARKQYASKVWIDAAERRQYQGLVFDPSRTAPRTYYNLWRGWSVEPAPPNTRARCQRFLDHVADNVCCGDEALFAWVIGWFAQLVQQPTQKLGTSLVLRGNQGTGKTIVGRVIGSLLGDHYQLVANQRYVVGRFNAHLANCLLLQLDEATWGGDHAAAGVLKDLITGDYQHIEYKGREPVTLRNYVRLLITGNNRWLVPAGLNERRFAVLDVGDERRQDAAYFQAIEEEMEHGGREALLRYLLDYDLSDVPLRTIPATLALVEQKISSLSVEQHWWLDVLTRGALPGDVLGEGETETGELYKHYLAVTQRAGVNRRAFEVQLGHTLRGMVSRLTRPRRSFPGPAGPRRHYVYVFPQLAACRREFSQIVGGDAEWSDDLERWQPDAPP